MNQLRISPRNDKYGLRMNFPSFALISCLFFLYKMPQLPGRRTSYIDRPIGTGKWFLDQYKRLGSASTGEAITKNAPFLSVGQHDLSELSSSA